VVIVHRDISPHNVLVARDGNVKVTDFGIAKVANQAGTTAPGVVKGKINYIAPEIFTQGSELDGRVDIFAAGSIFFQCLTNATPFFRQTDVATMRAILEEPIPSLRQYRPELGDELDVIVRKALARSPAERFRTAHDFATELEAYLARTPGALTTPVASWISEVGPELGEPWNPFREPVGMTPTGTDSPLNVPTEVGFRSDGEG
jgi:serine/threonine-protein kinase